MKSQLMYTTNPFDPNMIDPISNFKRRLKPTGGMWTCDMEVDDGKVTTEWASFVVEELPSSYRHKLDNCTKFIPKKGLKILNLVSVYDVEKYLYLPPNYEYHKLIDWEALAREYDGVHVEMGRYDNDIEYMVGGWDISSTLWLRPDWYESYSVIYRTEVE